MRKKNDFWVNFQGSKKFLNEVGNQLVKSNHINRNLTTAMYFLIKNLHMLLLLSLHDDRLARPFYTMKLLLADKKNNESSRTS